jgi:hypothetical protein
MKTEPAVLAAAVAAIINALVLLVFNEELDQTVQGAIVVVVTAIAGLVIRSQVTPVNP